MIPAEVGCAGDAGLDAGNPAWQQLPVLMPHPLQRLGAFALATLADSPRPADLTPSGFRQACRRMVTDLTRTSALAKPGDEGGWWLRVAYWMWPNSPGTTNSRGRSTPAQRAEKITAWRTPPAEPSWPGLPCWLCRRPAVTVTGKVDIPLAAAVTEANASRNATHQLSVCWGCLCSFWAAPYGAFLQGRKAASLHTDDEQLMAALTAIQVRRTGRAAQTGTSTPVTGAYLSAQLTVHALRGVRPAHARAGVSLLEWSNDNQNPSYRAHHLSAARATWLRSTVIDTARRKAWPALCRAFHTSTVPGYASLAHALVTAPDSIPSRIAGALRRRAADGSVPAATAPLALMLHTYLTEVLHMSTDTTASLRVVAEHIADTITTANAKSPLAGFLNATNEIRRFKQWV